MLLSYKWMDGWVGLGSLCGATIRASLRDANNTILHIELLFERALSQSNNHKLSRIFTRKLYWWVALILAPPGGVGVNYCGLGQSEIELG